MFLLDDYTSIHLKDAEMYLNLLTGKAQISVPQTNLSFLALQLSVGI